MAIAESETMSQGLTPRLAKLEVASTILPLLIIVWGSGAAAFSVDFRGLIREVEALGMAFGIGTVIISFSEFSDSGSDSLRLFRGVSARRSSWDVLELELWELEISELEE